MSTLNNSVLDRVRRVEDIRSRWKYTKSVLILCYWESGVYATQGVEELE